MVPSPWTCRHRPSPGPGTEQAWWTRRETHRHTRSRLGNSLAGPHNGQHRVSVRPSNHAQESAGTGKQPTLRSQHCSCQTPADGGGKPWRIHNKLFFTHKEESCLATRMHLRHVTGSEPRKPVTEDHLGHHPIDMKCPESANLGTEGGSRMRFSAGAGGRKLVGAGMGPMRTRTVGS